MFSNGTDDTTAEWAARLKSHWFFKDLGGTGWTDNHPGVQGVWGDNFLWYDTIAHYQDQGYEGSPYVGTAQQWDTGLVRNMQKVRSILGENALLGGNDAANACVHEAVVYHGSIPNGDCTSVDAAMWESTGYDLYAPQATSGAQFGWDTRIPEFDNWIKAGQAQGRAKYGIMVLYGTCGLANLGHPLTAQDLRVGLAMATIGGIDLWAVHDCNWGTAAVPGGQFSIPEMGDTTSYPRGWLGQPTSDPVRVALGHWKRAFTGGTVYANITGSSWSVDGHTVPVKDALFVKN
jgi:hypothetical protein